MTDKPTSETEANAKKPWQKLEIEQLDVPSATQAGAGRLQPGEGFNFYRNS